MCHGSSRAKSRPLVERHLYDANPGPALPFEIAKRILISCAWNGIPTHSITSTESLTTPWYRQSQKGVAPGPDTDSPGRAMTSTLRPSTAMRNPTSAALDWPIRPRFEAASEDAFPAFENWLERMMWTFRHYDQNRSTRRILLQAAGARHT